MPTTVILGAQWGDEGKGKVVDHLSAECDTIVRFNGGANAGHTIWINGRKIVLHLLPSGIARSGTLNLVGKLVACDLPVLADELVLAEESGAAVVLDPDAPVVLPIHKELDGAREAASGKGAIGTTKRGIGPIYGDYWARYCLTLGDLVSEDRIRQALTSRGFYAERLALADYYGLDTQALSLDATVAWAFGFREAVWPHLGDTVRLVREAVSQDRHLLFEGAQGVLLDRVHGTVPYCTSSPCTAAGIGVCFGVQELDRVIGVAKAYCTRVGEGPFPSEQDNEIGEKLRQLGNEYGATTGRPRRCGWIDLRALRFACRIGGITEIALTKLDILDQFSQIQAVEDYDLYGRSVDRQVTPTARLMEEAKPFLVSLPGWQESISRCRKYDDLPPAARSYIRYLEWYLGVPVRLIGVGPDREEVVVR